MIFEVIKYTFNEGECYKLKNIIGNDIFKENYNKGIFALNRISDIEDIEDIEVDEKNPLRLYLVQESMINDYDYDYDDNIIDNWISDYTYIPISYCPFTGEKIEINIIEEKDISKEVDYINGRLKYLKKYHSLKKRREYEMKSKELYNLINDDFA